MPTETVSRISLKDGTYRFIYSGRHPVQVKHSAQIPQITKEERQHMTGLLDVPGTAEIGKQPPDLHVLHYVSKREDNRIFDYVAKRLGIIGPKKGFELKHHATAAMLAMGYPYWIRRRAIADIGLELYGYQQAHLTQYGKKAEYRQLKKEKEQQLYQKWRETEADRSDDRETGIPYPYLIGMLEQSPLMSEHRGNEYISISVPGFQVAEALQQTFGVGNYYSHGDQTHMPFWKLTPEEQSQVLTAIQYDQLAIAPKTPPIVISDFEQLMDNAAESSLASAMRFQHQIWTTAQRPQTTVSDFCQQLKESGDKSIILGQEGNYRIYEGMADKNILNARIKREMSDLAKILAEDQDTMHDLLAKKRIPLTGKDVTVCLIPKSNAWLGTFGRDINSTDMLNLINTAKAISNYSYQRRLESELRKLSSQS